MENKVVNLELKTNVEESIAGLKALKRQLKDTAAGSAEFKQLYNQIDDLEDKIKSSKNASSDWIDSLEQAGGPLGMVGSSLNKAKVATQSFGGALKATGIGLFVSLIGGLVAAFSENEGAMKKIQPLIDGLKKAFQGVFRAVEPLFNTFVDLATDALPYVTKGIGMVYSAMMAYFTFLKEAGGGAMKILKGVFTLDADAISSGIDQVGGSFKKTTAAYGESMKRFEAGSKELTQTEKDEAEKREQNRKDALEKKLENEKKAKEKADELEKKKLEDKKNFDEETKKQIEELNRFKSEKELEESINKRNLLDEQIALLNEEVDAVQAAETKKATLTLEQEKAVADGKKAIQDSSIAAVEGGISLLKGVFEKNKTIQKGLIMAESAMGIAKIVTSTQAANAADRAAAALMGPAGGAYLSTKLILNKVGAGIGIAANIAATSKALSALGGGGGASGGGGDTGSGGGAAPQFNVVGQGGANQIAQSMAGQEQQPIKAFVVANDVTTGQSLNRNIINNASIG